MATAIEPGLSDAHTILRLLPHGVIVVASDWRVLYANPEADRMLGVTAGTLWERCPDLANTAFASGFRYAMSDRTELLTESALPSIGWCQARARPTPDGGLLISLRQIHAHTMDTGQAKQALLIGEIGEALTREDALNASLQRCTAAIVRNLDAALARVWTTDPGREVLELCASSGLDTATDRHQALVPFGEGKIGEIAADGMPYLTNDVQTDRHVGRSDWLRRERIVSFAGYPLRIEDRIVGVLAMYSRRALDHDMLNALSSIADALALGIERKTSDATRRRLETQLRAQADRLSTLFELGKQLVTELDAETLIQKVTDTATRLAGAQIGAFFYHLPSPTGETSTTYAVSGASREAFATFPLPRMTRLLAPTFTGDEIIRIGDVGEHADYGKTGPHFGLPPGHPPIASYLAVPVRGRNNRVIGALLLGHDKPNMFSRDTEQLIAGIASTAAIAMDNARLFSEAHELIAALEKTNHELDEFAYVASHDLKAPLRGIANLAQWIEDDLGERIEAQTKEHMHLLRGRVTRLENLIGGILAYSRAARDTELNIVDCKALAREVWELIAPPPTASFTIATELPRLTTSRTQLQQVLMNLIGNAIKYNPGRTLQIELGARHERERWVFWVKDDGVGIAPEFHDKIWGLFQTLARRDSVESTGIGLSVVRKIVEAHRGKAWVESTIGAGATFFFTWPGESARGKLHG